MATETGYRPVRVAELFAGSRSLGREAEAMGMEVFSVDNNPKLPGIHLVADLEFVRPEDLPWAPDIIWASPPCTTYSLAAISDHRDPDGTPRSEFAAKSDRLTRNLVALIQAFPSAIYYVENPMATLRNMDFMAPLGKPVTVWYCRYGDKRAKPTDIWSNNLHSLFNPTGWSPRPICWNGNRKCHHEKAPRGSRTGTQGLKNAYDRGKIPPLLCREVLLAAVQMRPKTAPAVDACPPTGVRPAEGPGSVHRSRRLPMAGTWKP